MFQVQVSRAGFKVSFGLVDMLCNMMEGDRRKLVDTKSVIRFVER